MNQLATVDMDTGEIVATTPTAIDSARAKLPATYTAARTALAECSRIDECQEWADKAQALASYARQAKDETLRRLADRIQARAARRCGELLKQIPRGDESTRFGQEGAHPPVTRTEAAADAGLSEHQRKQALRIASIPEGRFEELVESDSPPTVTDLAQMGMMRMPKIIPSEPDVSAIQKFARFCGGTDAASLAASVVSPERKRELKALIGEIDSWLDQFITSL